MSTLTESLTGGYFNPRSREGSDKHRLSPCPCPRISIRAPVKGATRYVFILTGTAHDFNPRSREGSDSIEMVAVCSDTYFNPRSREGSDSTMIHPMTNI